MLICVFFLYMEPLNLAGVCWFANIADTRMRIRSIKPLAFAVLGLVSESRGLLGILMPLGPGVLSPHHVLIIPHGRLVILYSMSAFHI